MQETRPLGNTYNYHPIDRSEERETPISRLLSDTVISVNNNSEASPEINRPAVTARAGKLFNRRAMIAALTFVGAGIVTYFISKATQSAGTGDNVNGTALGLANGPTDVEYAPRLGELKGLSGAWHNDFDQFYTDIPAIDQTPSDTKGYGDTALPAEIITANEFKRLRNEDLTRRLKDLLVKTPLLKKTKNHHINENTDRDLLLYLAHYPVRDLVNKVIDSLNHNIGTTPEINSVAYAILKEYEQEENPQVAVRQQKQAIEEWLNFAILDMSPEEWILRQIPDIRTQDHQLFHQGNLQRRLLNYINTDTPQGTLSPAARAYYEKNILQKILPTLVPANKGNGPEEIAKMDITQPEWGFLHAGARLLKEANVELNGLSAEEIEEVGIMLDTALRQGVLSPIYANYFSLPALIHSVRESTEARPLSELNDQELASIYQQYFTVSEKWLENANPFSPFSEAVENWKTRPELARQQLKNNSVSDEWLNNYLNQHQPAEYEGNQGKVELPNIDKVFEAQNQRLADLLTKADRILLPLAFETLGEEEQDFISKAQVSRVQARFDATKSLRHVPLHPSVRQGMQDAGALKYSIPETLDLLQCRQNGAERIYALEKDRETGGYTLKRVDRDRKAFLLLLDDDKVPRKDPDYELIITQQSPLKAESDTPEKLINMLAQTHGDNMFKALNEAGYEKTTKEKVADFFLSLVPFYTCVTESIKGNAKEAVPACLTDAVGMLPVVGQSTRVGSRFSQALGNAAIQSLRHGIRQATLKRMLAEGGKQFIGKFPVIAKEVSPQIVSELGISAFHSVTPGSEILTLAGKKSFRIINNIINNMEKKGPALTRLAEELSKKAAQPKSARPALNQQKAPDTSGMKTAYHPQLQKNVKVIYAGMDKEGRMLWKMKERTADPVRKKYFINEKNELQQIPVSINNRLYIIKEKGLGGRGGPEFAAQHPELKRKQADMEAGPSRKKTVTENTVESERTRNVDGITVNIKTSGDPDSALLLYPESDAIPLQQEWLDATRYEEAVAALTPEQKNALRQWSALEFATGDAYSDGMREVESGINYDLNSALARGKKLTDEQQNVYNQITEVIDKKLLPTQHGDYFRLSEYTAKHTNPWQSGSIKPGDYVTNGDLLMSVSSDTKYATSILNDQGDTNDKMAITSFIFYKFQNTDTPVPLLFNALSKSKFEYEYLFAPGRVFKVKGVATAEPVIAGDPKDFLANYPRSSAILEEVTPEELEKVDSVKNLFTGEERFRRPVEPASEKAAN